jgi:hypothetical protein
MHGEFSGSGMMLAHEILSKYNVGTEINQKDSEGKTSGSQGSVYFAPCILVEICVCFRGSYSLSS